MSLQDRLAKLNMSHMQPGPPMAQPSSHNPRPMAHPLPHRSTSFSAQPTRTDALLNPHNVGNMPNGHAPASPRIQVSVPGLVESTPPQSQSQSQDQTDLRQGWRPPTAIRTELAPRAVPPLPRPLAPVPKTTYYRKPEPAAPIALAVKAPAFEPNALPTLPRRVDRLPAGYGKPLPRPTARSSLVPAQPVAPVAVTVKSKELPEPIVLDAMPRIPLATKPGQSQQPLTNRQNLVAQQPLQLPRVRHTATIPNQPVLQEEEYDEQTHPAIVRATSNPASPQEVIAQVPSNRAATKVRSALSFGFDNPASASASAPPPVAPKPKFPRSPPPIPGHKPVLPSRLPSLNASLYKTTSATVECLECRDFSSPDAHATSFPRQSFSATDLTRLAQQLTQPFPSPTDKARVLFTWLHHNIAYDTNAFFSRNIKPSTPASTFTTGLAVCEGYAGLFAALALHAGLDCITVSGHGKGYNFSVLAPDDPLPPPSSNHAWNAVRLDDGSWHLVDATWGAGTVSTAGYKRGFDSRWFTMGNEEFGARHSPTDLGHCFRRDGKRPLWEEYIVGFDGPGEDVLVFSNVVDDHGLAARTFLPRKRHIATWGPAMLPAVRFEFRSVCMHWDNAVHGKGPSYGFLLRTCSPDGQTHEYVPFEYEAGRWYLDMVPTNLGMPGQTVEVLAVTDVGGKDARGLTSREAHAAFGKKMVSFGGVAQWELM